MLIGLELIALAWVLYYPTNWFIDQAWDASPTTFIIDLLLAIMGGVCLVAGCISAILGIGLMWYNLWRYLALY